MSRYSIILAGIYVEDKLCGRNFKMAMSSENMFSSMHKMCRFRSSCACAKYHPGLCSPCIYSIDLVSNDSVSGQRGP